MIFQVVNPGLINPKRLFNWWGNILSIILSLFGGYPHNQKPWFINSRLILAQYDGTGFSTYDGIDGNIWHGIQQFKWSLNRVGNWEKPIKQTSIGWAVHTISIKSLAIFLRFSALFWGRLPPNTTYLLGVVVSLFTSARLSDLLQNLPKEWLNTIKPHEIPLNPMFHGVFSWTFSWFDLLTHARFRQNITSFIHVLKMAEMLDMWPVGWNWKPWRGSWVKTHGTNIPWL